MDRAPDMLLTDLYQLNMVQAYLESGKTGPASFELFFRTLPERRRFLMAAGLEQVLGYLEGLAATPDELDWLRSTGRFSAEFVDYLADLRFEGDVHAMPEGTICFADEPVIRITAPLPVAQLIETRVLNLVHFSTLISAKAARMVLAARGRTLVDFGLRRAHGAEAGVLAARAAHLAGFAATATVEAGRRFGIPLSGTMAHAFVQAFDDESEAFEAFARARPDDVILLIDTYDTEAGARKAAALAPRLAADGIAVRGVRIDSGDLGALAVRVRAILDGAGLGEVAIFASGGLDEDEIAALLAAGAPIDGFGVGSGLTISKDVPTLDSAYKLQEFEGVARKKKSSGKETLPGRKQVWRRFDRDGLMAEDVISTVDDRQEGTPLVVEAMRGGRRVTAPEPIAELRARAAAELARLPPGLRDLAPGPSHPVRVGEALARLSEEVDRKLAAR